MLEIKVFGELEVRRGKRVVALPASKKSRALLAYLVVTARPHLREALCDLLWIGPDDPRAALRWSLTKIRGVVDTRLVADRERVSFAPGSNTSIDLVTARTLVSADVTTASVDALKRAAELTRGEFLEGLDLVDCYRFHEWCVGEREAARALRVSILAALAARLEDAPEEALVVARARVAVDPLSEAAHEAVIRILGKLGKKREALAQFDTCRRILQTELGAKPSASLLHARATLTPQIEASEPPPASPARVAPPRDASLLVGRRLEKDEIAARVRGAAARIAQPFLLFVGEAGIGKTRMLELCGDAMRGAGGSVLAGRAFEAESVRPYGPWIDALSAARVPDPLASAGAPAAKDQGRLFDAVGELVSGLAARAPLVILLDDLQWFDEASLALLHALSRALPPHVLFVCAARPAELADNAIAQRLVHALTREGRLVRHDLSPLAEAEVTELANALGAPADAARIFGESGGHPFFAVEIARALARGDAALPPTLTALIDDRLARLGALAKSLLPWAAAMRRGFDLDVLARATNLPATEVLEGALELEAHRVLEDRPGGGYDFVHDLLRSATYRKLSEPRRRWIHLQLARALSNVGGGASEIAHHAGLGGDHELAARAALDAARAALRVFANGEAARLGRLGVEHAASLPRDARLPLQVGLLDAVVHAGALSSRLEDEVLRVVDECEAVGFGALAAAGLQTLAVAQRDRGGVESAFANAVRASEVHESTDPGARALRLSATAKCLTLLEREMPRARSMLDEAHALAKVAQIELLDLHWGQGLLHLFEGDREASAKELATALELAGREEHRWSEFECLMYLTMIDLEDARPEDALVHGTRLLELAGKMREGSEVAAAAALRALAWLMLGREGADGQVLAAASALRTVDAKGMLSYVLSELARAELARGLFADAYAHAEEALRAATTVKRRSDEALARVLLVRAAAGRGDQELARRHLAELETDGRDGVALSARARREVLGLSSLSTMTPTLTTT